MCSAFVKFPIEMWVLVGETRISKLRLPENKSLGRILLSDFCVVLLHVYRTDPVFEGGGGKCACLCVQTLVNRYTHTLE